MKAYYIPVGRKRNDHANRNGETTMATATLETEVTEVESPNGLVIDTFRFDATIHNGYITIHNTNTGNHRTFRIETVKGGALDGKRIVSLLIGLVGLRVCGRIRDPGLEAVLRVRGFRQVRLDA